MRIKPAISMKCYIVIHFIKFRRIFKVVVPQGHRTVGSYRDIYLISLISTETII